MQAKTKEESTIKRAHDEIKDSKAQQAEARYSTHKTHHPTPLSLTLTVLLLPLILDRLKYLLGQSDIFSHFGVGGGKPSSSASAAASAAAGPAKRGRRAAAQADEMDDDEKAMAKAAGGEDEGEDDSSPQGTVLLRQPSSVSGGQMR